MYAVYESWEYNTIPPNLITFGTCIYNTKLQNEKTQIENQSIVM